MFDIGVNLTSNQFVKDVPQVISQARQAGLNGLLITGTSLSDSHAAAVLAAQYADFCWSTAGVHPHNAKTWNTEVAEGISQLTVQQQVVAIGECGLDFNRNFSTPDEQERAFTEQLALAVQLQLPVFLHCRDAHQRFMALLAPWLNQLPPSVLHCFTGNQAELEEALTAGLSIGITGWVCDERRGLDLRKLLPLIPQERLLLETDAPYLLPRDLPVKPALRRNEPCYLPHIIQSVATARNEDPAVLQQISEDNARRLFKLAALKGNSI